MQRRQVGNLANHQKEEEQLKESIISSSGSGHITLVDHIVVRGELIQVRAKARSLKVAKVRLLKRVIAKLAGV